mgnify:CR=1 FL=1
MGSPQDTTSVVGRRAFIVDREALLLVTGANGYIGSKVVRALLELGFKRIRCLTRPTSKPVNLESLAAEFGASRLEIIKGNLLSRETCRTAAEGVSVILHLAADAHEVTRGEIPRGAGDVAGPYQFTHTAAHQAWYAAVNALFDPFKKFKADYRVIPWSTFVEPEVARVGLNEQEAQEKGIACEVSRYDLAELDRAIVDSTTHGFVKVLTVPGRDTILGVTIVGEHAGDLIAEYVLAMKHGIGLNKILGTLHIYPTLAEANKYAAGVWKKAHAPERLLRWVERFHAWRRGAWRE